MTYAEAYAAYIASLDGTFEEQKAAWKQLCEIGDREATVDIRQPVQYGGPTMEERYKGYDPTDK